MVEDEDELLSCCSVTIVPNLSGDLRPDVFVENVVTSAKRRREGLATYLLRSTLVCCWEQECHKVMLMTGSKRDSTLEFYRKLGFSSELKTGFIAYPR